MNIAQQTFYMTIPEDLAFRGKFVLLCEYFSQYGMPIAGIVAWQAIVDTDDFDEAIDYVREVYFGETGFYELEDGAHLRPEYMSLPLDYVMEDEDYIEYQDSSDSDSEVEYIEIEDEQPAREFTLPPGFSDSEDDEDYESD